VLLCWIKELNEWHWEGYFTTTKGVCTAFCANPFHFLQQRNRAGVQRVDIINHPAFKNLFQIIETIINVLKKKLRDPTTN